LQDTELSNSLDETTVLARHGGLMRAATYASVTVAAILVVSKLATWWLTDSVAVLSSLVDSALDMAASLFNLWAVAHALTPADREHRFGHGKAEALAGLAQSAFVIGSAVFLLFEAVPRLLTPREVERGEIAVAVMLLSIVLTLALLLFQRFVIKRTGSLAVNADSLHYRADLLANIGVILAVVASVWLGWRYADPLFAVAIAIYIVWSAWGIVRQSLDQLMDRELPETQRAEIEQIATRHPDVVAVHDLRTRSSGVHTFIQLHLEMDGDITLHRAHDIADAVELLLLEAFPGAEVIIHQDPAGLTEEHSHFRPTGS